MNTRISASSMLWICENKIENGIFVFFFKKKILRKRFVCDTRICSYFIYFFVMVRQTQTISDRTRVYWHCACVMCRDLIWHSGGLFHWNPISVFRFEVNETTECNRETPLASNHVQRRAIFVYDSRLWSAPFLALFHDKFAFSCTQKVHWRHKKIRID